MNTAETNRPLLILNICWWLITAVIAAFILSATGFTTKEIIFETVTTFSLFCGVCFLLINNMRYYLPQREKYWYLFIVGVIVSGICSSLSKLLVGFFLREDVHYIQSVHQISGLRFGVGFLLVSCIAMMSLLWYNQQEQKKMDARKAEAEQLSREAELFKLRQQLQPHFLFNSLNSISALTAVQPEKARHMINQLSEFLRGTLKKDERVLNTLEEEMQYLELYLEIEKVRFGHRLQTKILCDENALQCMLPAMLLQPVVENAIKFGLYDTTGEVLIKIDAAKQDNNLKVSVQNPFDPETAQPLKGTGFGLPSIQRRLFLLFARQDLLTVSTEENHFITTISIPQIAQRN